MNNFRQPSANEDNKDAARSPNLAPQPLPTITIVPPSNEGSATTPSDLTVCQTSLAFLDLVEMTFADKPRMNAHFLAVLNDFNAGNFDIASMTSRVHTICKDYPDLIRAFNAFLEPENKIHTAVMPSTHLTNEQTDPSVIQKHPLVFDWALEFVDNAKKTLAHRPGVYDRFMGILREFASGKIELMTVMDRVVELLKDHPDLLEGFKDWLPAGYSIVQEGGTYHLTRPLE